MKQCLLICAWVLQEYTLKAVFTFVQQEVVACFSSVYLLLSVGEITELSNCSESFISRW